ncbi:FtsX-like permease family protein [Mucilaginibacter koreensis]
MSFSSFVAGRITFQSKRTFSKLIVRIAIIGIMLGLGVMILSVAIVKGFKQEIREKVRGFAGDIQVVKFDLNNSYENTPFDIDAAFLKKAEKQPLIQRIMPYATKPGIIKANGEIEGVVLKGVDASYDWRFFNQALVKGRVLGFKDSTKHEIMISSYTAARLKLKLGDSFLMYFVQEPLKRRKFTICGIFNVGVDEVDKTFVISDLQLVRGINNWAANTTGGYEVRTTDFDHLDAAFDELGEVMPAQLHAYTVEENYSTIFEWLKLLDVNTQVMLVLMLLVAVINMISALLIMILERTSTIGMFKAMGADNWSIQKIFLYNAAFLIGMGLLLGNLLGLGLGYFQQITHFFKLDQASYYMNFVPIEIKFTDVLLLNIGTLLLCLLVLLIPSTLVSRISPVRAIRFK